jgi:hypothetical protein
MTPELYIADLEYLYFYIPVVSVAAWIRNVLRWSGNLRMALLRCRGCIVLGRACSDRS